MIKKKLLDSKRIIALLMSISMLSSCSVKDKSDTANLDSGENYISYLSEKNENMQDYLLSRGIVTDTLNDGTIYINSYRNKGINNILVYNIEEFKDYLDIKNPTIDDIKKVIYENEYICEYFKEFIIEYVDLIKEKEIDVDLSVFYYNLTNLKIEKISREEMDTVGKTIIARFDARNHRIVYVDEMSKNTFMHELTHLITDAYLFIDDNTLVHKTLALLVPILEEDTLRLKFSFCGFLEGATELMVSNINIRDYSRSGYYDFMNSVQYSLELIEMDVFKMEEEGIVSFINNLIDNNAEALNILSEMDSDFNDLLNGKKLVKKI